jgi:hypothetical protein
MLGVRDPPLEQLHVFISDTTSGHGYEIRAESVMPKKALTSFTDQKLVIAPA